jgi:hypothetical protein
MPNDPVGSQHEILQVQASTVRKNVLQDAIRTVSILIEGDPSKVFTSAPNMKNKTKHLCAQYYIFPRAWIRFSHRYMNLEIINNRGFFVI